MPHIFDPAEKNKLDTPERRAEMPPEKTLLAAGVRPMDIFLDIGCGTGYFTLPAARLVGPKGKVYALDISAGMLSDLRSKLAAGGMFNIETVETDPGDLKLQDAAGTMALLSNVLHEVEDKFKFLVELNRVLQTGGRLSIIEWQKRDTPQGPPLNERLDMAAISYLLDRSGFTAPSLNAITPAHNLYNCTKKQ